MPCQEGTDLRRRARRRGPGPARSSGAPSLPASAQREHHRACTGYLVVSGVHSAEWRRGHARAFNAKKAHGFHSTEAEQHGCLTGNGGAGRDGKAPPTSASCHRWLGGFLLGNSSTEPRARARARTTRTRAATGGCLRDSPSVYRWLARARRAWGLLAP